MVAVSASRILKRVVRVAAVSACQLQTAGAWHQLVVRQGQYGQLPLLPDQELQAQLHELASKIQRILQLMGGKGDSTGFGDEAKGSKGFGHGQGPYGSEGSKGGKGFDDGPYGCKGFGPMGKGFANMSKKQRQRYLMQLIEKGQGWW